MENELVIESNGSSRLEAEIPSALTIEQGIKERAPETARFAGKVAFFVMFIPLAVSLGLGERPGQSFGRRRPFSEMLMDGLSAQINYFIPLAIVVFIVLFLGSMAATIARRRPLYSGGTLKVEDGTVEFWKTGRFGAYQSFSEPVSSVQSATVTPIANDVATEVLPLDRHHEVTLLTDTDMHVLARGLDSSSSEDLAEAVARVVDASSSS